jgi:hypothetical protein
MDLTIVFAPAAECSLRLSKLLARPNSEEHKVDHISNVLIGPVILDPVGDCASLG